MEEQKTNKIIARTALITLFTLLMVLMLSFNIIALASPRLVGDFANRLGMGGVSVSFAKGQYERSKSADDLGTLCERAVSYKKYKVAEQYLLTLIEDGEGETLKELAARKNATSDAVVSKYDYEEYIVGNYAFSLYRNGKRSDALDFAKGRTRRYDAGNAIGYVVDAFVGDEKRDQTFGLVEELQSRQAEAEATGSKSEDLLLCIDLVRVHTSLGNAEKIRLYSDKLEALLARE